MASRFGVYGIAEGVWHHRRCIFYGLIPFRKKADHTHGYAVIKERSSNSEAAIRQTEATAPEKEFPGNSIPQKPNSVNNKFSYGDTVSFKYKAF